MPSWTCFKQVTCPKSILLHDTLPIVAMSLHLSTYVNIDPNGSDSRSSREAQGSSGKASSFLATQVRACQTKEVMNNIPILLARGSTLAGGTDRGGVHRQQGCLVLYGMSGYEQTLGLVTACDPIPPLLFITILVCMLFSYLEANTLGLAWSFQHMCLMTFCSLMAYYQYLFSHYGTFPLCCWCIVWTYLFYKFLWYSR